MLNCQHHHSSSGPLLLAAGDSQKKPGPVSSGFCNICSTRNKAGLITEYVNSSEFDIFGLTETLLKSTDPPSPFHDITPSGYILYHIPCTGRSGGGVGWLAHNSLCCNTIPTPCFTKFECLLLTVRWSNINCDICTIYRPPNTSFPTHVPG
jgi:hypothetical protein